MKPANRTARGDAGEPETAHGPRAAGRRRVAALRWRNARGEFREHLLIGLIFAPGVAGLCGVIVVIASLSSHGTLTRQDAYDVAWVAGLSLLLCLAVGFIQAAVTVVQHLRGVPARRSAGGAAELAGLADLDRPTCLLLRRRAAAAVGYVDAPTFLLVARAQEATMTAPDPTNPFGIGLLQVTAWSTTSWPARRELRVRDAWEIRADGHLGRRASLRGSQTIATRKGADQLYDGHLAVVVVVQVPGGGQCLAGRLSALLSRPPAAWELGPMPETTRPQPIPRRKRGWLIAVGGFGTYLAFVNLPFDWAFAIMLAVGVACAWYPIWFPVRRETPAAGGTPGASPTPTDGPPREAA